MIAAKSRLLRAAWAVLGMLLIGYFAFEPLADVLTTVRAVKSGGQIGPVAVLERTEHEFGTVAAGTVLRTGFQVKNMGDRRLILEEHSTSCRCVSANGPVIIVEPGRFVELKLELRTDQLSGPVRKEVRYASSDPQQPVIPLVLSAHVSPPPAEAPSFQHTEGERSRN